MKYVGWAKDVVMITNRDDEVYFLLPTGFDADMHKRFIMVDAGPHWNGQTSYISADDVFKRFGLKYEDIKREELWGVNTNWMLVHHPVNLGYVMEASECKFIGTEDECKEFVATNQFK